MGDLYSTAPFCLPLAMNVNMKNDSFNSTKLFEIAIKKSQAKEGALW